MGGYISYNREGRVRRHKTKLGAILRAKFYDSMVDIDLGKKGSKQFRDYRK